MLFSSSQQLRIDRLSQNNIFLLDVTKKTFDYFKRSLAIYEEVGDKTGTSNTLRKLAGIYKDKCLTSYLYVLDHDMTQINLMKYIHLKHMNYHLHIHHNNLFHLIY